MSDSPALTRLEARRDRLSDLFESVTGTTVIEERQEEQVHRLDGEGESSTEIESYLEKSLGADGLEDAIGTLDPD